MTQIILLLLVDLTCWIINVYFQSMSLFRDITKISELAKSLSDSADEIGQFSAGANDTEIMKVIKYLLHKSICPMS